MPYTLSMQGAPFSLHNSHPSIPTSKKTRAIDSVVDCWLNLGREDCHSHCSLLFQPPWVHTYMRTFPPQDTHLSIIPWRFVQISTYVNSLFLFIVAQCSMMWAYHSLFSHSPVRGQLGCLGFGAIVNKAVGNIHVQVFVGTFLFSGISPQEHNCWMVWSLYV